MPTKLQNHDPIKRVNADTGAPVLYYPSLDFEGRIVAFDGDGFAVIEDEIFAQRVADVHHHIKVVGHVPAAEATPLPRSAKKPKDGDA